METFTAPNFGIARVSISTGGKSGGDHREDGQLVRAVRNGDRGAFEALVARYQRRATALAFRLLDSRDDALEVVQDAFLNAFQKLSSLSDPGLFRSWLLRITGNLALNRRRARALRRMPSLDSQAEEEGESSWIVGDARIASPAVEVSARELQNMIARELQELPEMQRQALVMFSIEKMPQKEVADLLGCSVEAVKWHVFTARKKLKDKLKDYL